MIITLMFLAAVCALGLVHLFELGWANRPPAAAVHWPKARAMRFAWVSAGILVVLGQMPAGILLAIAGLPVCLAHLRLVDRNVGAKVGVGEVVADLFSTARASFSRFMDRTRIGPRR
jgi:hypothetical protein